MSSTLPSAVAHTAPISMISISLAGRPSASSQVASRSMTSTGVTESPRGAATAHVHVLPVSTNRGISVSRRAGKCRTSMRGVTGVVPMIRAAMSGENRARRAASGNCSRHIELTHAAQTVVNGSIDAGTPVPENKPFDGDKDLLHRAFDKGACDMVHTFSQNASRKERLMCKTRQPSSP